jgi:hypothetical protein
VTHLQHCHSPKNTSQLRRFLGMLNFCRWCLPHAAATQAPLHDVLLAPESRAPTPSPGRRNSSRSSKIERRIRYAPLYWRTPIHPRSSQMPPRPPWVACYSNVLRTPGNPSLSFQNTQPRAANVQHLRP